MARVISCRNLAQNSPYRQELLQNSAPNRRAIFVSHWAKKDFYMAYPAEMRQSHASKRQVISVCENKSAYREDEDR